MAAWRLVAAILAALLGVSSVVATALDIDTDRAFASDFTQDWLAARALVRGEYPYQPTSALQAREFGSGPTFEERAQPAPHPPALIALYVPLSRLPFRAARLVWLALSAALIAAACGGLIRAAGARAPVAALLGIGVLAIPVAQKELAYGQTNAVLLGLIALAWLRLRQGRHDAAGVGLGIAAAFKLFPLLLLIPLLRFHRGRAPVFMAGTFAVLTLGGMLAVGWRAGSNLFTEILPSNSDFWIGAPMNLSLVAIPQRWLADSAWVGGVHLPLLAGALMAVLFALCLAGAAGTPARLTRDPLWETIPWMLLASPLAWEFSLVLLLPLAIGVVARAVGERRPPPPILMVALALIALGIPPGLPAPEVASVPAQLLGYALPTYGLLVVAIAGWTARAPGAGTAYSS